MRRTMWSLPTIPGDVREALDPRGRSCPLAYRYQPEALAGTAQLEAATVYVVGGLYGNPAALAAVLERADREPSGSLAVVFNGDFHWLDVDPEDFRAISEAVLARHATKGNVEAELASDEDAGCGCAYPDYVVDQVVARSNQIMTRLRATASRFPSLVVGGSEPPIPGLPMPTTPRRRHGRVGRHRSPPVSSTVRSSPPSANVGSVSPASALEPSPPSCGPARSWVLRQPPIPRRQALSGASRGTAPQCTP